MTFIRRFVYGFDVHPGCDMCSSELPRLVIEDLSGENSPQYLCEECAAELTLTDDTLLAEAVELVLEDLPIAA